MLFFILRQILLSLTLIVVVHYIYIFFKENLTIPKIKDLVNKPKAQYEKIYRAARQPPSAEDKNLMKNELQSYLKELNATTQPEGKLPPSSNDVFGSNYQTL